MFSLGQMHKNTVEQRRKWGVHDGDPRWPSKCDCGYEFAQDDIRQFFVQDLFRKVPTGELYTLRNAPIGAMWYADWMNDCEWLKGPDGRILMVRVPGENGRPHDWTVDGRASNCGSPCTHCKAPYREHVNGRCPSNSDQRYEDSNPKHKCWIRHGTPPSITVDKNGHTCDAGAGSILTKGWHGFLRNGHLVT